MVRRSTSTGSTRSNETDPAADNGADSGASNAGADSGVDTSGGDTSGVDTSGVDTSGAQGGASAPPPTRRRTRGPNKPKPGTFVVETNAHLKHEEIIKLLNAHAVTQLGANVAMRMTLHVDVNGEGRPLDSVLPPGATLRFGNALKADE